MKSFGRSATLAEIIAIFNEATLNTTRKFSSSVVVCVENINGLREVTFRVDRNHLASQSMMFLSNALIIIRVCNNEQTAFLVCQFALRNSKPLL